MPSYSPSSIRGKALEKEFLDLLYKRAIEQAPQTPGFYSRLFVVQKDPGSWRPIIDLSTLNTFIDSESRRYLRFTMGGVPYQFRVLCFGLTTALRSLQGSWLQYPPFSIVTVSESSDT